MISKMYLTSGPSREQLFDCQRLGPTSPNLGFVEFYGEIKLERGGRSKTLLQIKIEGTHCAGDSGRDWFFFGRLVHVNYGKDFSDIKNVEEKEFCFGRWNVHRRTGFIQFAETSFFTHPAETEEEKESAVQHLRNYAHYTLRQLPSGRYQTTLSDGRRKSTQLEIQPYNRNLRVRFLSGCPVKSGGRPIENSQWTILSLDQEARVSEVLQEVIEFV